MNSTDSPAKCPKSSSSNLMTKAKKSLSNDAPFRFYKLSRPPRGYFYMYLQIYVIFANRFKRQQDIHRHPPHGSSLLNLQSLTGEWGLGRSSFTAKIEVREKGKHMIKVSLESGPYRHLQLLVDENTNFIFIMLITISF